MKVHFFTAGSTSHVERVVIEGGAKTQRIFPSLVTAIEHPREGVILFDTGYTPRFHEVTRYFPEKLYALATPVEIAPEETAVNRLKALGIGVKDVRTVICSHFHADHVAGVSDFPSARYVHSQAGYSALKRKSRFGQVKAGFLRGLLPADFESRSRPIESWGSASRCSLWKGFENGYDLFGDGALVAVDLPGHSPGQLGLMVRESSERSYFLVADACWLSRSYQEMKMPSALTRLVHENFSEYRQTLRRIHELHQASPELQIVPCHCSEAVEALV